MPKNYRPEMKDRKRYEDRDGTTLVEVISLAKKKNGWRGPLLAANLGISDSLLKQWGHRGVRSSREIPKLINLTRLAGLSDAEGIVIILRHMIPVEFASLQQYVGCTVRRYRKKTRKASKRVQRAAEEHQAMREAIPRADVTP